MAKAERAISAGHAKREAVRKRRWERQNGDDMPKGSKVDKVYQALRSEGKDKGTAARIAQSATGQSLKTGKPPKRK